MSDWKPPKHGPRGSLLRALQRGTGGGYLRALKAPREQVQAMLLSFAEEDPRWDPQIERRTEYWGDLAVAVGLPAEPLLEIALRLDRVDEEGFNQGDHYEALSILEQMAARGRADALESLVGHIERGVNWEDSLRSIDRLGPEAVGAAADALVRRFGSGPELKAAMWDEGTRWDMFEELAGPVGDAARSLSTEHEQRERAPKAPRPNLQAMTLEELREHANDWNASKAVAGELRRRKTPFSDIAGWLRPGRRQPRWQEWKVDGVVKQVRIMPFNHAGTAVLQAMQGSTDPAVIAACVAWLEEPLSWRNGRIPLRRFALGVLQQAPASVALPIARRWWSSRRLQGHALDIFEVHGEPGDFARVVALLQRPFTQGNHHLIDGALDALLKHPEYGPFPGLESLYHRAAMSCTRKRAVNLMAVTEPGFGRGLAFECLWDAEGDARMAAARVVDLSLPGVRERLEFLAVDSTTWEDERAAAQERLDRG